MDRNVYCDMRGIINAIGLVEKFDLSFSQIREVATEATRNQEVYDAIQSCIKCSSEENIDITIKNLDDFTKALINLNKTFVALIETIIK